MRNDESEQLLVDRVRSGDEVAWQQLIDRYEGRLFAYVNRRLGNPSSSEDVVQETFMGFLISLPNYDDRTPLESYLFSISAHKLTDLLRRQGRRPAIPLVMPGSSAGDRGLQGSARRASSMARSGERRVAEEAVIAECLAELIETWRSGGEWERLQCMELLLVRGWPNKKVAASLGLGEQAVANHKHFVMSKIKDAARLRYRNLDLSAFGID